MKKILCFSLLLSLIACNTNGDKDPSKIILDLEPVEGYGPFPQQFASLNWTPMSDSGEWAATKIPTNGVPESWIYSNVDQIWLDAHQFVYQNYKGGKLPEEFFNKLKQSWNIDLTRRKFSEEPINCFVHVAFGKTATNQLQYVIDTDHDRDFADETIHTPPVIGPELDFEKVIEKAPNVNIEISTNKGISTETVKLLILNNNRGGLIYNIPTHFKTELSGQELLVSNGFINITFDDHAFIAMNEATELNMIDRDEFIRTENGIFKNLGVNLNSRKLELMKMPEDTLIYSTAVGFNALPFHIKRLENNDSLALSDFKGKFLYLEFWGTWCRPCIDELPNLKKAYAVTQREDIEFFGVAVNNTREAVTNAINKYDIQWLQALESESNDIREVYQINTFPTSFLIDPKGKIVAKNLRGENLIDTLNHYIQKHKQ